MSDANERQRRRYAEDPAYRQRQLDKSARYRRDNPGKDRERKRRYRRDHAPPPQVTITVDLYRRLLEDAWSHRETLLNGYWCSDCDQCKAAGGGICGDCQRDKDAMDEYQRLLDCLVGGQT